MKKLILLLIAFAALANGAAWGQKPFYGEWCVKSSGKLEEKIWDNGKVQRTESFDKDGKSDLITLIFPDSLCLLNPDNKTYMVFVGDEMKKRMKDSFLGMETETLSSSTQKKFIKQETISGFLCSHYKITRQDQTRVKDSGTVVEGSGAEDVWTTPEIRHDIQHYGVDITMRILKNIVVGPQPAHLFVVPKGYKRMSGAALMDRMQQMMGDPKKKQKSIREGQEAMDKLLKGEKTSDKKANDWMDAGKKAEEMLKKKK